MSIKKIILSLLGLIVLLVATVGTVMYNSFSPAAPVYEQSKHGKAIALPLRMRNWEEHDAIRAAHPEPYVLELSKGKGALVFYGAHHTRNPDDPQQSDIERRWETFKPTVALHEGRQRNFFDTRLLDRVKGRSEAETLHLLAMKSGVKIYTLEPSYEDEITALVPEYGKERVAMYFTLRGYFSEAGGAANDALALDLLTKRTATPWLAGSLKSVADLDRVWKHDFPNLDWRTTKSEPDGSILHEMSDVSRKVRGEHMARTIIDLTSQGERVFAVVGSGHVIRLEWILRAALGAPPSADQHLAMR